MLLREASSADYGVIRRLYVSAFPIYERAPFFFLKRRALQNRATMLVAEDGGSFVGFAYTVGHGNLIYLFFFAVDEVKRGGGSGSEILRLLKARYPGKTIFLAREPLDDSASNSGERIKRRSFYLRNGFTDLPYQIREASVIYDLMSTSAEFDPGEYDALIHGWAGKIVTLLVKMEIVR